jgi:hypothetical protein
MNPILLPCPACSPRLTDGSNKRFEVTLLINTYQAPYAGALVYRPGHVLTPADVYDTLAAATSSLGLTTLSGELPQHLYMHLVLLQCCCWWEAIHDASCTNNATSNFKQQCRHTLQHSHCKTHLVLMMGIQSRHCHMLG